MLAGFVGLEDGTTNLRAFLFLGTETAPRHLTKARTTDALSLALFRLAITHSLVVDYCTKFRVKCIELNFTFFFSPAAISESRFQRIALRF